MEPVYSCSMIGPSDTKSSLYTVLSRRRGHVLQDEPIAGTPLYNVRGLIPVIDSFGFETDLRIHAQGQVSLFLVFDRWSIVPGDPLDKENTNRPWNQRPRNSWRETLCSRREGEKVLPRMSRLVSSWNPSCLGL